MPVSQGGRSRGDSVDAPWPHFVGDGGELGVAGLEVDDDSRKDSPGLVNDGSRQGSGGLGGGDAGARQEEEEGQGGCSAENDHTFLITNSLRGLRRCWAAGERRVGGVPPDSARRRSGKKQNPRVTRPFRVGDSQRDVVKLEWVPIRLGDDRGVVEGLFHGLGRFAVDAKPTAPSSSREGDCPLLYPHAKEIGLLYLAIPLLRHPDQYPHAHRSPVLLLANRVRRCPSQSRRLLLPSTPSSIPDPRNAAVAI